MCTYHVGDAAAHARDEDDAPAVPEAFHLAACSLRCEEDTIHINVENLQKAVLVKKSMSEHVMVAYLAKLRRRILEAIGMSLQDTSGGDAGVHAAFLVPDVLADLPHIVLRGRHCEQRRLTANAPRNVDVPGP